MKTIKLIFLVIASLFLSSCTSQENARLEAFKKQEHRFEFRDCEFYYNDQRIELYKPKSYIENIFGTNYLDEGTVNFYRDKPLAFQAQIRSRQKKNIIDVSNLVITFMTVQSGNRNYEKFKDFYFIKDGEYILIDGIPFGHGVSINELNKALRVKGKLEFSGKFAGSSGIKARGYTDCENFPQFFISYNEKGELRKASYLIRKPKHLN